MAAYEKIFAKLPCCACFEVRYIKWIPVSENESIVSYAQRLSEQIDRSQPFVIAGVSFGGIIALEIAKLLKSEMVILISSAKNGSEIPPYYSFLGVRLLLNLMKPFMGLKRFIPLFMFGFLFGISDPILMKMLKAMAVRSDPELLLWSLKTLSGWRGIGEVDKLAHIHGIEDRLFPIRYVKADLAVAEAGHLLVYTHGAAVMRFIHSVTGRSCGLD